MGQALTVCLVLVGFAIGMIVLQTYMTLQYVDLMTRIYVPPGTAEQMPFSPMTLTETLIESLDLSVSWVLPVVVASSFLILRAVGSTSRAAKICLRIIDTLSSNDALSQASSSPKPIIAITA